MQEDEHKKKKKIQSLRIQNNKHLINYQSSVEIISGIITRRL